MAREIVSHRRAAQGMQGLGQIVQRVVGQNPILSGILASKDRSELPVCVECGVESGNLYPDLTGEALQWLCTGCHPRRENFLSRCQDCGGRYFSTHKARRCYLRRKLQQIDLRHRWAARPDRLRAIPELHESQTQLIQTIAADPDASYVLCGLNQTGKTHLAVSLYKHALSQKRFTWYGTVNRLTAEHHRASVSENDFVPSLTVEKLNQQHTRWSVFLNEFEKGGQSDFRKQTLFALLDAIWENGHQLVITTNIRKVVNARGQIVRTARQRMMAYWGGEESIYGPSIVSRLNDCTWIETGTACDGFPHA